MIPYDSIVVLGPTASGKTKFAVNLAEKLCDYKAEIISADSRQVYRNMDIGTGKDLCEYNNIPYHLINVVEAGTKYNIFSYQKDFSKVYSDMLCRGAFPIICGGSGLYIQAVTCSYDLKDVPPDNDLRNRLEAKSMEELIQLFMEMKQKRGEAPHNITDFDTKHRIIRAIEIERAYVESSMQCNDNVSRLLLPKNVLYLGIDVDREERNRRIDLRLAARLKEGMVEEVKKLLNSGIKPEDLIYYGLEYKFITQYIIGILKYDEMVEKLAIAIHQFAKRQMTWFRGMERKGIKIWWSRDGIGFYNNFDDVKVELNDLLSLK